MKKVLAVILVVSVVFVAGAAIAQPKRQPQNQPQRQPVQAQNQRFVQNEQGNYRNNNGPARDFGGPRNDFDYCRGPRNDFDCCRGPRTGMMPYEFDGRQGAYGMRFAPDMPKEIREKVTELAKLRIDLEEALTSNPVNKAKALEVYAKMQQIENEIDAWRFAQKLDRLEEMRIQRELNKNVKPQAPAPKPEDKAEAPTDKQ